MYIDIVTGPSVDVFPIAPLQTNTGILGVPIEVASHQVQFWGYRFHNANAAAAFVSVFFLPGASVTMGTTPPGMTIKVGDGGTVTLTAYDMFEHPIQKGTGLSFTASDEEDGTTAVSTAVTGYVIFKDIQVHN